MHTIKDALRVSGLLGQAAQELSRLLERAAQQFQYFKNEFFASVRACRPQTLQKHDSFSINHHSCCQAQASIMKFNSCESAIAFINPRIHAGHTNSHDPINDHMTTHRSDSVICEFSAV
jgi:hypothetical protein